MQIGQSVGKYVLVQKTRFRKFDGEPVELWVFMDGDKAVEWNPAKGEPTEKDLG